MLAPTDGTASGHERCKKPKGIPINESALRHVEAAAIRQQVLVFEAATGRSIDEAFDRGLGDTLRGCGVADAARWKSCSQSRTLTPKWRDLLAIGCICGPFHTMVNLM